MPSIQVLKSPLMTAVSAGASRQASAQRVGFARLAACANSELVNKVRRRAVILAAV